MNLFNINRDSWMYMRKTCDATIIMLERTMYLATILLLKQYRFHNHCSDGKHNAKVWTAN